MLAAPGAGNLGEEFTGELTRVAQRRLLREKASLEQENLHSQGIYHHFDEAQPHRAVALLLGPEGTPYARGLYFFEFTFPNNYPLRPPNAAFRTGDGRVRFNPNLYVDGKVCLSILGTWRGPSWTSLCTFRTMLLSIQSLLCSQPLQNEPGHEQDAGADCELYSAILRYENVAVSALQLSQPLLPALSPLRAPAAALFLQHFAEYLQALEEFDGCEGNCDRCPLYGFITRYSPERVRQRLEDLRRTFLEEGLELDAAATSEAAVAVSTAVAQEACSVACGEEEGEGAALAAFGSRAAHVAQGRRLGAACVVVGLRRCCLLAMACFLLWMATNMLIYDFPGIRGNPPRG
mmetsp:Transcript_37924/g.80594  ORF Transcript_37924/g.80594 Transcript_37924/m.80594 type:complete len:348 (+) Transcript_37924:150-1193(+)